ncbi:MAG TPA: leucine--tRNA ligase [Thermomicrobiales bacterium]|nr:leucine--tRNA ligase [Thermomicrobiales bacterium]
MATTKVPEAATSVTRRERYIPQEIEQKWRDVWAETQLFKMDREGDGGRPKWYAITMYPYPSGDLHIGHWYAMTPPDAAARYRRMLGFNVFFPMGFDAFGLPAENAAIKHGAHPWEWTMANIENMRQQMRSMGTMFDWGQEVITCDPEYYKWNQWFFLQFLKHDLAYRKEQAVWWCPGCQTVLANEQVIDGRCERCETEVYQREMEQWFFRITKYADELLSYEGVDWPEPVRIMQRNWIGRSEGARVSFSTEAGAAIEVFTTRPDTLWGATFMVLAPEHPLVETLTTDEQRGEVEEYIAQARRQSEIDRMSTEKEKTGVFTGGYAINPVNGEQLPVWIADYVLVTYGTGAVMAVPAHDERDFEFALKFGLPIVPVIARADGAVRSVVRFEDVRESGAFAEGLHGLDASVAQADDEFHISLHVSRADDYVALLRAEKKPGSWISFAGARNGLVFDDAAIELASVANDTEIVRRVTETRGNWFDAIRRAISRDPRTAMEILRTQPFYTAEPDVTYHHDYGAMINSDELSGTPGEDAVRVTIEWLEARGAGRGEVNYRMRDWLISRQRYWGTPFPIIYCDTCGIVPVPEEDLPVLLPEDAEFKPTGESPLRTHEGFLTVPCPQCGGQGRRETDTMDTFMDSSWYQYRFLSPHYDEGPFEPEIAKRWLPVDQYTGGIEHATMHLLYTRFFTKAMRDMGLVDFDEPFMRLMNQGIILGEDSEKMSKSRGNVIDPDDLVFEVGTDAVRLFLMFLGPWEQGGSWNSRGIAGPQRFLDRAFSVVVDTAGSHVEDREDDSTRALRRRTHQTIRDVTKDYDTFSFNTMVAHLMEFVNELMRVKGTDGAHTRAWREAIETLPLLLAPAAPHIAEELWQRLGREYSVHDQRWPAWDEALAAEDTIEIAVQVNGKVRGRLTLPADVDETHALATARVNERVAEHLSGATIVKEIYVPGRLINFVVR